MALPEIPTITDNLSFTKKAKALSFTDWEKFIERNEISIAAQKVVASYLACLYA